MLKILETLAVSKLFVGLLSVAAIILAIIILVMIVCLLKKNKANLHKDDEIIINAEIESEDINKILENDSKSCKDETEIEISDLYYKSEIEETDSENETETTQCRNQDGGLVQNGTTFDLAADIAQDENRKKTWFLYRKSFRARLIQSSDTVKIRYSIIRNCLLSYKKVKSRVSWNFDSINFGRKKLVKLNASYKTLYFYCSLSLSDLEDIKFTVKDVSDKKKYSETPILLKIKSERGMKNALLLIDILAKKYDLKISDKTFVETKPEDYPFETRENLIMQGLIKIPKQVKPL